jgi:hypothetical protein
VTCQDEAGRLWDVVWMLRFAIRKAQSGQTRLPYALYVRNSDSHPARLIKLIAVCGPLEIDDAAPAITVMMPDERLTNECFSQGTVTSRAVGIARQTNLPAGDCPHGNGQGIHPQPSTMNTQLLIRLTHTVTIERSISLVCIPDRTSAGL